MQQSDPQEPRVPFPRALLFGIGVTSGVLAALVAQILMSRHGLELEALWRDLHASQAVQLRSAGAWWLMAGTALIVSALAVMAATHLPLSSPRWRPLPWIAGAAIVYGLADVGHSAAAIGGGGTGAQVALNLAAFIVATLLALAGAAFTTRR